MNELSANLASVELNQFAKESLVKTINLANIINELAWK